MIYFLITGVLLILEISYFRIADHFNIIDKPNHRSSHTSITIRGGGIIFYIATFIYFFWSEFQYPYFFFGLTLMALISFLDDIFTLSNKLRITIHLVSVLLLLYQIELFSLTWFMLPIAVIVIIGVINAYNFMDGINGITTAYSFAVLFLLWLTNRETPYVDEQLLYCVAIGNLVFAFFNFRQKAKCFAGDVGSVSMAFILIFFLSLLILSSGNLIYLLFLATYGVDTVWTILRRLYKKENIFEAHRSHLYQYLANEAKINKLGVSFAYGAIQTLIGVAVIYMTKYTLITQVTFSIACLLLLSAAYLLIKHNLLKKYNL
ncbi:MraY family glycosyltransferase [Olivibacter domesticus]|uniref:UDP-N-acetylmuramyl pentapeptide phosphotransferase/UDP-N-acetylglucosamine-1-phosphate transferase n=1 Tax=Olivibacter domesticus TaxID=407022 RepID=A0A1H7UWF6_OLID1|nr:glycosyltransferase family 4 protein [Olivibacter domesticus]SEM01174.1 UDP-N-acetylmuramyl pentapeptide phosphotransferase/UDP-N-acetylglucosamine-1-phosphate transferase [Olivibacter domesticus]